MKMDSLSKSSSVNTSGASSNRSSGIGSGGGGGHVVGGGYRESAHFANIMVEFETSTREMAVDVPDSFIGQTKTPPKYPTSYASSNRKSLQNGNHRSSGASSSEFSSPPSAAPPTLSSRDHLRIEQDGHLRNTLEGPQRPTAGVQQPTPQQSQRMKKYSEEISKRNAQIEKRERTNDFLRQSIRNSQKMNALKETARGQQQQHNAGMVNGAFEVTDSMAVASTFGGQTSTPSTASVSAGSVSLSSFVTAFHRLQSPGAIDGGAGDQTVSAMLDSLGSVVASKEFQRAYKLNQKLHQLSHKKSLTPTAFETHDLTESVMNGLCNLVAEDTPDSVAAKELSEILEKESMEGLLYTHDRIAAFRMAEAAAPPPHHLLEDEALMRRLGNYSEPNIKIVRIEKTTDPLGATVKNEDDAVVVGRIIRGGTAEQSGLLHEGDEILEVNEVPLRGKNVNEVCQILADMQGTLTLLVVPTRQHVGSGGSGSDALSTSVGNGVSAPPPPVMHVKAHIDYDPDDDPYLPCKELGIGFEKGEIMHVINQKDPHWWQARREGEDETQLPGLIPSASFQQQREAIKHTIAGGQDSDGGGVNGGGGGGYSRSKSRTTGFLCAKRSRGGGGGKGKKGKGKPAAPYAVDDENEADEVIAYEEVALYYPRSDRKRPVVLIGPPNIGRHELRQKLMQDGERFAAAIPHTSRARRSDEVDGQDYHFISRMQFEQDILSRKFVEHGEYEKAYYGTSIEAIRSVVLQERICVLNLHPQSLKILKGSDLMPFVVFVAPPSLERLKRLKIERSEPVNDDELKEIIERAREMEDAYGHYFDMVISYADSERAYHMLLEEINLLEREPQWVPASWVQQPTPQHNHANSFYK